MLRCPRVAFLLMATGAGMAAQTIPGFDVAAIKPCKADDGGRGGRNGAAGSSPGRFELSCRTLEDFIRMAYLSYANGQLAPGWATVRVPIEGGPAWVHSDRYTIEAEAEGAHDVATIRGPMLRALLEDRFQLKAHHETREIPVYDLVIAKGGVKLKDFHEGDCVARDRTQPGPPSPPAPGEKRCGTWAKRDGPNVAWESQGMGMNEFCNIFLRIDGMPIDRPVIDKTGLKGLFSFHLEFAADETQQGYQRALARDAGPGAPAPQPDEPRGPSIFTALQQQLGLKLEAAKGQGELVVIDRAERPSEN